MIGFGTVILACIITFGILWIKISIDMRKEEQEKERIKKEREEKIRELNQSVKDGKWLFPAEEYYYLCRDN